MTCCMSSGRAVDRLHLQSSNTCLTEPLKGRLLPRTFSRDSYAFKRSVPKLSRSSNVMVVVPQRGDEDGRGNARYRAAGSLTRWRRRPCVAVITCPTEEVASSDSDRIFFHISQEEYVLTAI